MTILYWAVALVALQRLAELVHARRNTARLRARGGIESGAGHYPLIVVVHGAWLGALVLLVPAAAPANWYLLGAYVAVQGVRYWTIASLGEFWTTRIITVPGAAPVRRGPYRFMRHPNYVVVACEIALLPLAFGAWRISVAFTMANAAILALRIGVENRARATN